jgi:hypothetical protein
MADRPAEWLGSAGKLTGDDGLDRKFAPSERSAERSPYLSIGSKSGAGRTYVAWRSAGQVGEQLDEVQSS